MGQNSLSVDLIRETLRQLEQGIDQAAGPSSRTKPKPGPRTSRERKASMDLTLGSHDERLQQENVHTWRPPASRASPMALFSPMPPIDTIPHLTAAQHSQQTFAGKLYWTTMTLAYRLLCAIECDDASTIRKMLLTLRYEDREIVKRRLFTKFVLLHGGDISQADAYDGTANSSPITTTTTTTSLSIRQMAINELIQNGQDVTRYLDSREVELHLRRRYVDPENLAMYANPSHCGPNTDQICSILLEQLAPRAVCYGEGPRWHIDDVERSFESATGSLLSLDMATRPYLFS